MQFIFSKFIWSLRNSDLGHSGKKFFEVNNPISIFVAGSDDLADKFWFHIMVVLRKHFPKLIRWSSSIFVSIQTPENSHQILLPKNNWVLQTTSYKLCVVDIAVMISIDKT